MTHPKDPKYRDRISDAVLRAIIKNSISTASDGQRVAALLSGDILDALCGIEALLLASSPSLATPTELRRCCDDHAKRLYRRTRAAQAHPGAKNLFGGMTHTVDH